MTSFHFICLSSCSSFLRPCTIRHHQHNEKHSVVESGRWHSSHRQQHGGEDRRLRQRECLGQRLVPGFGDLNAVPGGILEHHLPGQLAAGRQSAVALRRDLQKEVENLFTTLKVRFFKLFIFVTGLISSGRRTSIWTTCLAQSSPCCSSLQFTFTSSEPTRCSRKCLLMTWNFRARSWFLPPHELIYFLFWVYYKFFFEVL